MPHPVPVVGAICLKPRTPAALKTLRQIAELGMTMCETILDRDDTLAEHVGAITAFLDEASSLGISVLLEPTYEPDLVAHPQMRCVTSEGRASTRANDAWGGQCFRNSAYLQTLESYITDVCRLYMSYPAILQYDGRPVVAVGHEMQYQVDASDGHGGTIGTMTCYCDDCVRGFREQIAASYDSSIDQYNRTHRRQLRTLRQVTPPKRPQTDRVLWQEWVDYHAQAIPGAIALQRTVIEREVPKALVTHEINDWYPNTWDCIYSGNHFWKMGERLEHAFNDQYPMEWAPGSLWRIYLYTFTQDVTQSAIGFDRSFWTNGQAFQAWQGEHIGTEPPDISYHEQVYSALIHGANGLIWWTGGDLLSKTHDASTEMRRLIDVIGDIRPLKDPIALLVPWTTYAQTRSDDRGNDLVSGYQLLSRLGYQIETVDEGQIAAGILDTRGHKVLCIWGNSSMIMPAREQIENFVRAGGLVLADFGDLDTAPFGTVFPETISLEETESLAYYLSDGTRMLARARRQALRRRKGCQVQGQYTDGSPAIVRYGYGAGTLWRAGSLVGVDYASGMGLYDWVRQERVRIEPAVENMIRAELTKFGLEPIAHSDNPNVEVGVFPVAGRLVALVVNHLVHPAEVSVTIRTAARASAVDVLNGGDVTCIAGDGYVQLTLRLPGMGGRAIWMG